MNIKHILFPVDFSDCSRGLNPEVEWASRHFDADVTLMHVFEIPVTWYGSGEVSLINAECLQQFADDAKKRLKDYALQIPETRINRVIAEGDAAWHIKKWVEEHPVDLVMMGTHGYGSLRRALLGSVAMKLLHDVSCPVWTHSTAQLGSLAAKGMSTVLCALELTQEAVPLLRFAKEIAQDCGASVRIVHSVPEMEPAAYRYFDADLHKYLRECAEKDIRQSQQEAGTDFAVTITDGPIARDTAALASEQKANLIVIGRGKAQEVFGTFRSHTYELIRQAPCAVLSYCAELTQNTISREHKESNALVS